MNNCRDCGINDATPEEWDAVSKEPTLTEQIEKRVEEDLADSLTGYRAYVDKTFPQEEGQTRDSESVHPRDRQEGGTHYKTMKHQPLQQVLDDHGYEAFRGACLCKVYKYIGRTKEDRLRDYKAARHVLEWLIIETENKQERTNEIL